MAAYKDISDDLKGLEYKPEDSYFLGVCVDRQTGSYKADEQDPRMLVSGKKIEYALVKGKLVSKHNSTLCSAICSEEDCSFDGIKDAFKSTASEVGEEGIFFFHFSGHGITSDLAKGLAPADYDDFNEKCITATTLTEWLRESNCNAKFVVFTLDCCYSGGVANALTRRGSSKVTPFEGLQIMASCKASEASFIINALGCSVFSYFLSYAISAVSGPPEQDLTIIRQYPIKAVHEKCHKLSEALSSLFLGYDKEGAIYTKRISPVFRAVPSSQHIHDQWLTPPEGREEGDVGFSIREYFRIKGENPPKMHLESLTWLNSCFEVELEQLATEGPSKWEPCLVKAVLCGMLRSIAILQQTHDPGTAATVDMYLTCYMSVVTAILGHQKNQRFSKLDCIEGLTFYRSGLRVCRLDEQYMEHLEHQLKNALESVARNSD